MESHGPYPWGTFSTQRPFLEGHPQCRVLTVLSHLLLSDGRRTDTHLNLRPLRGVWVYSSLGVLCMKLP